MKTRNNAYLSAIAIGIMAGIGVSSTAFAESIYRVTSNDGIVYYTDIAPGASDNAEALSLLPAPSETDTLIAQENLRQYRQQSAEQSQLRAAASQINAVDEAEKDKRPPPLVVNPFIGLAPFL